MASSDHNKENPSSEDRVEKIKKEEKEDPTAYYSQGDSKDDFNEEVEFSKPIPPVENALEEVNLTRAVAYLGFGLAALAIVFILFFIRDLDDRVGGVDSAVSSLEEKIAPLKKEVKDSINKVNADIAVLTAKMVDNESRQAVIELKRALVAIQGMKKSGNPEVKTKSTQLTTSIELLIGELGDGLNIPSPKESIPAGEVIVKEEPVIELPAVGSAPEEHVPVTEEETILEVSPEPGSIFEAEDVPVTGIPELIAQCLDKIVDNAVEFSTAPTIRVSLSIEGEWALVRVMNEGPELPAARIGSLFESMVSVRQPGVDHLGLGLYVAKTIIEYHGGEITLKNNDDLTGVVAAVRLPILRLTAKLFHSR